MIHAHGNFISMLPYVALSSLGLLSLACTASPVHADVRYTTEMAYGGEKADKDDEDAAGGKMQTTTYVRQKRERVEMLMAFGPIKQTTITITQCDKQQTIQLDTKLKIYTVSALGGPPAATPPLPGGRPNRKAAEAAPGEGKVVSTFTVQDMGKEKIGELMTRHSMLTTRTQTSGCIGASDTTSKMEMWTADIKTFYCPERYASGHTAPNENGCKITYETKGDTDALKDIYGGMIVQQKMYQDDKVMLTQKLKDYSEKELDAALFEAPAGFKEVTAKEFADAEQKAMLDGLRNLGKEAGDGAAEDEGKLEDKPADTAKKKKKKDGLPIPIPMPF